VFQYWRRGNGMTSTFHLQRFPADFYECALAKQTHIPPERAVQGAERNEFI